MNYVQAALAIKDEIGGDWELFRIDLENGDTLATPTREFANNHDGTVTVIHLITDEALMNALR
jgi:hypothetical protein